MSQKRTITTFLSRKRAITPFLSRKFMITRSSIAFEDFLGSSIAPKVMPPWVNLIISPHHISDNCDPPLNAAMAIRIRVGWSRLTRNVTMPHSTMLFSFICTKYMIYYLSSSSICVTKLKQAQTANLDT